MRSDVGDHVISTTVTTEQGQYFSCMSMLGSAKNILL